MTQSHVSSQTCHDHPSICAAKPPTSGPNTNPQTAIMPSVPIPYACLCGVNILAWYPGLVRVRSGQLFFHDVMIKVMCLDVRLVMTCAIRDELSRAETFSTVAYTWFQRVSKVFDGIFRPEENFNVGEAPKLFSNNTYRQIRVNIYLLRFGIPRHLSSLSHHILS